MQVNGDTVSVCSGSSTIFFGGEVKLYLISLLSSFPHSQTLSLVVVLVSDRPLGQIKKIPGFSSVPAFQNSRHIYFFFIF